MEHDPQFLERGAVLGDVITVHQLVGVLVEQVDGGAREHDVHIVLAGDDAERDAQRLVGPVGDARVFGDDDDGRLAVGHGRSGHLAWRRWRVGSGTSRAPGTVRCR